MSNFYSLKKQIAPKPLKTLIITLLIFSILFIINQCYLKLIPIWNEQDVESFSSLYQDDNNARIKALFHDFFNQSSEQRLVDKNVLMQTIRFMIEETHELDPELVAFVRTLIVPPAQNNTKKLNLTLKDRVDFSQVGQSKYIDSVLSSMRNGFFIESGGLDGESHSNSLFFELERNWTGILIEPIPSMYRSILAKNRNIYVLNGCIGGRVPLISKFRVYGGLSGRVSEMDVDHHRRIDREGGGQLYANVPCFSINTIIEALRVEKVDYFSLDVEGGEWSVLSSLDFERVDVSSFSIEHNFVEERKNLIKSFMEEKGYELLKQEEQDIFFIKKQRLRN